MSGSLRYLRAACMGGWLHLLPRYGVRLARQVTRPRCVALSMGIASIPAIAIAISSKQETRGRWEATTA
jgi:hypothetical protein